MASSRLQPDADLTAWEGSMMLHVYMYDYCKKRNFHAAAAALAKESGISPSHKVPVDAPQGLLFEWWSVFWEIFISRTPSAAGHGSRHEDAATYNRHLDMREAANEVAAALETKSRSSNGVRASPAPAQPPTGNASLPVVPLTSSGAGHGSSAMSRAISLNSAIDPRTPEKQRSDPAWASQPQNSPTGNAANGAGNGPDLASRIKPAGQELIAHVMRSLGWADRDAATLSLDERNKLMAHVRQVQLNQARAQMQMAQARMAAQQSAQGHSTGGVQPQPAQGRALQSPFMAPVNFTSPTQPRTPTDLKRSMDDDGKPTWQVAPNLRSQQHGPTSGLGLQPSPTTPNNAAASLYASPDAQRRQLEEHAQLARQLQQQSQSMMQSEQRDRRPPSRGELKAERSPQAPAQPPTPRTPRSAASFSFAEAQSQVSQQIHALQQGRNQSPAQIGRLQKLQSLISQGQSSAAAAEDQQQRGGLAISIAPPSSRQPGNMGPPPPSPQAQGAGAFMPATGPCLSPSQAQSQLGRPPASPHHSQPQAIQLLQLQHPQHPQPSPLPQNFRPHGELGRAQGPGPSTGHHHGQDLNHGAIPTPGSSGPSPMYPPSASPGFPQTELFGGHLIQSLPPGPSHGGPPGQSHGMPGHAPPGNFAPTPNSEMNPSPFAGFDFGAAPPQHHHQQSNGSHSLGFGHGAPGQDPRPGHDVGMGPGMQGGSPQFAVHQSQGHGPPAFRDPTYDFVMQRH